MWKTLIFLLSYTSLVIGLHKTGTWNTDERVHVVSRFGIQQFNSLNSENTKGFIYGNVTAVGNNVPINENSEL